MLIFDEAHNIEDVCREAASTEVDLDTMREVRPCCRIFFILVQHGAVLVSLCLMVVQCGAAVLASGVFAAPCRGCLCEKFRPRKPVPLHQLPLADRPSSPPPPRCS